MKLFIQDLGENRDGKHNNKLVAELSWDLEPLTKGEREALRRMFWNFAVGVLSFDEDNTAVNFQDECLLCGKQLKNGLCKNEECAEGLPDTLPSPERIDFDDIENNLLD